MNQEPLKIVAYVHMFPPVHNAGSETTLLAILRGMVRRGHEVRVLASEILQGYEVDGIKVLAPPRNGVLETWAREHFAWSDVAITHLNCTGSAMRAARDTAKPLVHLVHNDNQLKFHNVRPIRAQLLIFNSEWVREVSPMQPSMVVHPIVEPDLYRVEPNGDHVTFVNLTVTKGSDVFYELARRLPQIRFAGVKGAYGVQQIPKETIHNVTIINHTPDIKEIYRMTKVVLMPSDYESYGRIAVEAACSGIPSIVHPTPGLKEALGDAGIYINRRDIDGWQAEITRLFEDKEYYAERSGAALALANSFQPEEEIARVEGALRVVARHGLKGAGMTVEVLGETEYRRLAIASGSFDPRREPRNFRPPLGDPTMKRRPFVAETKIYLDIEGRVVKPGEPGKHVLLVGPGQEVPYERALELGLITEETTEEKAQSGPSEVRALTAPRENKAIVTGRSKESAGALVPPTEPQTVPKQPRQRRRA